MASQYCSICRSTTVRIAGETCAQCRYKLSHPDEFPEMAGRAPAEASPGPVDLQGALQIGLGQAVELQRRLQAAIDGVGPFDGNALNEAVKVQRLLSDLIDMDIRLRKSARGKVLGNDQRIEAVVTWARDELPKAKLERLKTLVAEL